MNRTTLLIPAFCGRMDKATINQALNQARHIDLEMWEQENIPYARNAKLFLTTLAAKKRDKHSLGKGAYFDSLGTVFVLLLITQSVTIPVGFAFYMPDPALTAWTKEDKRLKKQGMTKKDRPVMPERNNAYPTKTQLAVRLLQAFKDAHGDIKIKTVLADALYGETVFMDKAAGIFDITRVISQLRENQDIEYKGKKRNLKDYFNTTNTGVAVTLRVRGGKEVKATVSSARLNVIAHGKKRFVVALKYEGESDYRYLVATDMTWRAMDTYSSLHVEMTCRGFFEDGSFTKAGGVRPNNWMKRDQAVADPESVV